jgi:hypothetical protein
VFQESDFKASEVDAEAFFLLETLETWEYLTVGSISPAVSAERNQGSRLALIHTPVFCNNGWPEGTSTHDAPARFIPWC